MSAVLRHMALRSWLTALAGGLICLALLPWWQHVVGIRWLAAVSFLMLAACFIVLGWGMNRIGTVLVRRHLKEAAVWERAGMDIEAETAFQKAVALVDSFWLSPMVRRKQAPWFQGVLARFYLGRSSSAGINARSVVAGYLGANPEDTAVAQDWLEQVLIYPSHLQAEHEAAARVGGALAGHRRVQQLLMQFYLTTRRFDFDARQTYRRVWQSRQPLSGELICQLGRTLLEGTILSSWALQVYLKAHAAGETGALEGLAACLRWLPSAEENRADLEAAKALVADVAPDRLRRLSARFEPVAAAVKPKQRPLLPTGAWLRALAHIIKPLMTMVSAAGDRLSAFVRQRRTRGRLLRFAMAMALIVMLGISGWHFFKSRPEAPPAVVQAPESPAVTDPFTIQVAAYLRESDAQRFVHQLADKGLAAFWTKAASANRTWYQVKVSHFASKAEAQSYGQNLKSKGLIDDFYVANYKPPAGPGQ